MTTWRDAFPLLIGEEGKPFLMITEAFPLPVSVFCNACTPSHLRLGWNMELAKLFLVLVPAWTSSFAEEDSYCVCFEYNDNCKERAWHDEGNTEGICARECYPVAGGRKRGHFDSKLSSSAPAEISAGVIESFTEKLPQNFKKEKVKVYNTKIILHFYTTNEFS